MDDAALDALRVPRELRQRAREILEITDDACHTHLNAEYAQCCRVLVGRLARKRPSPLARGDARIWAAGAIYATGQVNFLFDRSQDPHLNTDQLAERLGVLKTTMANKAALINKTLEIDGSLFDARMLPSELRDEARRQGLIPDLDTRRAA
jgi:hypothetical protein